MSYLSRAQSFVERGEIMRAFYQLVNGLQRNPRDEHALDLLVDLYIREFQSPGVERDLLLVLEIVPQGIDLYEMIYASLEKSGDERRLKSLIQTREREHLLPDTAQASAHDGAGRAHDATALQFSHQGVPQRQTQLNHAEARVDTVHGSISEHPTALKSAPQHTSQPFDLSPNPRSEETQKLDLETHTRATHILTPGDAARAPESPKRPSPQGTDAQRVFQPVDPFEEHATTGVFSSIDLYLDEEHKELRQELAQRSKTRLLWLGAAIVLLISLLIFAAPARKNAAPANDPSSPSAEEPSSDAPDAPVIDEPLPNE